MSLKPELYEYIRRQAREHLAPFVRLFWGVINPGVKMRWNWHLDMLCDHLEAISRGEIKSLVISLPPGSCKSTLVGQCWPCWDWLVRPEKRWIFATNSLENARKEATYRHSVILSDLYWELSPLVSFGQSGKRVQTLRNKQHGEFRATSVGATITGAHFDYQIIDDPNDAQRIAPEELEAVNTWYDEVLSTRRRDGCATVLIQQRLARNDLVGHLLELGVDASIVLPAMFDEKIASLSVTPLPWKDPRSHRGAMLWPERQDEKFLRERRKILGSLAFSAQYQQNPRIEGGELFKASWWRRHPEGDIPPDACQWLMTCDTAASLRDTADLTVCQCWALTSDNMLYLIEQQSGHWDITEQVQRVKKMFTRYPNAKKIAIEERNGGFGLISLLQKELPLMRRRVWRWKSQLPKISRIETMAPFAENGSISIPEGAEGDFLIDQACEFPVGRHDDAIDCAAIAVDIFKRRLQGLPPIDEEEIENGGVSYGGTSIREGSSRFDKKIR